MTDWSAEWWESLNPHVETVNFELSIAIQHVGNGKSMKQLEIQNMLYGKKGMHGKNIHLQLERKRLSIVVSSTQKERGDTNEGKSRKCD